MSESEKQTALIPLQHTALTKVGAKSLVARGRAELRAREGAEEWFKKGLEFFQKKLELDASKNPHPIGTSARLAFARARRSPALYEEAFACFERGVQLNPNHPGVQFWLGILLHQGLGVQQDYVEGATWYRKAAEQGNAVAQYNLADLCINGQGVTRDYAEATFWWRKAAEQGIADAQWWLGIAYYYGKGVPQDYVMADFWYRKAAEQKEKYTLRKFGDAVCDEFARLNWPE